MNVCLEIGILRIKHFMAKSFVLQCYMSSHISPGVKLSGRGFTLMMIILICNRVFMFGEVAVIAFVFRSWNRNAKVGWPNCMGSSISSPLMEGKL